MSLPPDETPEQRRTQKNDRDLFFVVKLSSALGMGTLAGFLFCLKDVHPTIRVEFGVGAVVTFLLTAAISWIFCAVMARADNEAETPAGRSAARRRFFKRWLAFFGVVCGAGTVLAFARSLRNVSAEGRREVVVGTVLAVLVLSLGGWLIHRAMRFFEEQDRAALELRREDDTDDDE